MGAVRESLPPRASLLVAGGALRNLAIEALHGTSPVTRDIDLFVGNVEPGFSLSRVFSAESTTPTELGGIRWKPDSCSLAFDICRLCDFVVIKQCRYEPTLENLLNSIDFTANAIILDFDTMELYQGRCFEAIQHRILEFNTLAVPNRLLLAYRILVIRFKTGFFLSKQVFSFVKNQIDLDTLMALRPLLVSKQGKETGNRIMDDLRRICRYPVYSDYFLNAPEASPGQYHCIKSDIPTSDTDDFL